jgi:hypothetical protein
MAGIEWVYDDGGRAAAGFKGTAGDCATRAIAIAAQIDYLDVYDTLNGMIKDRRRPSRYKNEGARTGIGKDITRKMMADLGWRWTPTMSIGTGTTVHLRTDELPLGRVIVQVSKHVAAVIDGVLYDTHDSSRDGTRCVYGYWTPGDGTARG